MIRNQRNLNEAILCLLLFLSFLSTARADVWTVVSDSGLYNITVDTQHKVALGAQNAWLIYVNDKFGNPADIMAAEIKGGMPQHQHGLPGDPLGTPVDNQRLVIEPLRFHMPGRWFIDLRFHDRREWDSVLINFHVDATGKISRHSKNRRSDTMSSQDHVGNSRIEWTKKELAMISSLALPTDNRKHSSENKLVALGKALFADNKLSGSGDTSCVDCHQPNKYFTSDRISQQHHQKPQRDSENPVIRDVLSIVGSANRPWLNWDGRKNELWSQALLPLEIESELGNNRTRIAHYLSKAYHEEFTETFGELSIDTQPTWPSNAGPYGDDQDQANWRSLSNTAKQQINTLFTNAGKALGAYQTRIRPAPGQFDHYAKSLAVDNTHQQPISLSAQRGLQLFIGNKARCINCHNNSDLTNNEFERVVSSGENIDFGRSMGIQLYLHDEFNCRSPYSATGKEHCKTQISEAKNLITNTPPGAFRVPSLRGLSKTAPYMHDGRFADLTSVIAHYNKVGSIFGQGDLLPEPGSLSDQEQADLIAFLLSLGSEYFE